MCVISNGCGGFDGVGMEVVVGRHAKKSQWVDPMWEMPENILSAR